MRRYLPAFLLALLAFAPFPLTGCDLIAKLKGEAAEAGSDAAIVTTVVDAAAATPATAAEAGTVTALPTGTPTALRPVVVVDAGAKTDAGAPVADAGAAKTDGGPAPSPTPTLTIPHFLDGGLSGFKFDAGGFKPPWQK